MTQITVETGNDQVVIYDQYGASRSVGPDSKHVFELPDGGFCTISEATSDPGEEFAQAMIDFWQKIMGEIKQEIQDPVATPV